MKVFPLLDQQIPDGFQHQLHKQSLFKEQYLIAGIQNILKNAGNILLKSEGSQIADIVYTCSEFVRLAGSESKVACTVWDVTRRAGEGNY